MDIHKEGYTSRWIDAGTYTYRWIFWEEWWVSERQCFVLSVCLPFSIWSKIPLSKSPIARHTYILSSVYTHNHTVYSLSLFRSSDQYIRFSLSLSLIQNHSLTAKVVFYSLSLTLILASVSEIVIFSLVVDVVVDIVALSSGVPSLQCDQIGRFIGLWATF